MAEDLPDLPRPAQPLDYAPPPRHRMGDSLSDEHMLGLLRRLMFVVGLALLCYGSGLGLRDERGAEEFMGWGGALLGLSLPLGRWRLRD